MGRDLEPAPMVWQFIYLGQDEQELAGLGRLGNVFHRCREHWRLPQEVVHYQSPGELLGSFMGVIGQWLYGALGGTR